MNKLQERIKGFVEHVIYLARISPQFEQRITSVWLTLIYLGPSTRETTAWPTEQRISVFF